LYDFRWIGGNHRVRVSSNQAIHPSIDLRPIVGSFSLLGFASYPSISR
jgi:hypothetical protein